MTERNPSPAFNVWKNLVIGGKSPGELLELLNRNGFCVSDFASDIMNRPGFAVLPAPCEVLLVRPKVKDLGFFKEPTSAELLVRVKELGLDPCPAEVGPYLRLALAEQPKRDLFRVAMENIPDKLGNPRGFLLSRDADGQHWLGAGYFVPSGFWSLDEEAVVCLRP